jgi:Xaa-Pro aminopeptidase
MDRQVIGHRIKAIRRRLGKKKISCLLLTRPANVTYATGFLGEDSWAVIVKGRVYLLTDSRYTEQARQECPSCTIVERTDSMAEAFARLLKRLKSVRTVTVEASTSIADFDQLKKAVKARLKTAANVIEPVRSVKDDSELALIRTAASISTRALRQTLPYVKAGMTESELAGRLDFQIRKLGARNSFETIVAFGPNASRPHHQPGARKLKKKDTLLIDFGARYKGYCSDITRCFALGGMTALYQRAYDIVERAQAAAIKAIRPGVKLSELDAAARRVIDESDLPVYSHGTGHGFGLEIHETPFLKAEAKGKLKPGQVLTIEPGIYMPGKLGVRIEDDILVTETGRKILTRQCPHSPVLS